MGQEGILPFSKLCASNKPFNAPAAGLFEHWLVSVIVMLAPPPGDAYNFLLNLISYPLAIVNSFVSAGLIWLYLHKKTNNWNPPFKAALPVIVFFFLSNVYLVIAPYIPPTGGESVYKSLPYYLYCVVGTALFGVGGIYWIFWAIILPKIGKYELVRQTSIGVDGRERNVFDHLKGQ